MTLSTSGIAPGIDRLALEKVRPKLAISLNASSDEQRDEIMPINRKYRWRRCWTMPAVSAAAVGASDVQYVLLGEHNDSVDDARRVNSDTCESAIMNLGPWRSR